MIFNYLKLAFRILIRNPFFSLINILGLSIGFASFFALWQYSTSALKTDQHHKDFERIARIGFHWRWTENGEAGWLTFGASKASVIPQLKEDFPEVESYVRILGQEGFFQDDLLDKHGVRTVVAHRNADGTEKLFKQTKAAYADRNIFEFFTIPLIQGDAATVLSGANSIALSKSTAIKYFGNDDALGKELSLNDSISLIVTGVYQDMPIHSRINYDMIISNEGLLTKWQNVYWGGTLNFVKLNPGVSFSAFENKMNEQTEKYWANVISTCGNCEIDMFAQPLKDVAFSQGFIGDDAFHHPSSTILVTLAAVSFVILVMAWINYVNLALTRLNNRVKEFATRKVNGATALDLIKQFLTESLVINVLAIALSITLLQIIRQPLATLFEIHFAELRSTQPEVWVVFLITICCGVITTGLYPAFFCLKRNRASVYRQSDSGSKNLVSTSLTTIQFASALVLISWAFIVYLQLNHIFNQNIGLVKDAVIALAAPIVKPDDYSQKVETFLEQLKDVERVDDATCSRYMVGGDDQTKPSDLVLEGTERKATTFCNGVNENYIPFFGVKTLAGRNFVKDDRSDIVLISRNAAKELGFDDPLDAVGIKLTAGSGNWQAPRKEAEVIGVFEDYRTAPLFNFANTNTIFSKDRFGLFLTYKDKLFSDLTPENIAIKVTMKTAGNYIMEVESLFKSFFPGNVFEWRFLDDQINQAYSNEKIARNQILMFTMLAIGIACLGLVAMMAQKVIEKTKEISIRKILGATGLHIGQLLVHNLVIQLFVAALVALPVAFYLGDQYLQKYSERTTIHWWHFIMPLVILLTIMFISVASMLWKASKTNLVEALKYE